MVAMAYEWPGGKWLFQGIMASVLSGVGFVFLTLVFEYGKRYRRKRREREQQVILEKILRGDVVLEWQNPKAVVPVSRGCVLRDLSGRRGPFLISNYKQYGGFLGVGRGYYARRNKLEDKSNGESEQIDNRILFAKSNSLTEDSSQLSDNQNRTQELAAKVTPPNETSFPENKDEARIFQNLINSQSTVSFNTACRKDAGEPVQKDASQTSHMCKQMCEEMCYRIVKEHPFIAPYIRRDFLQEPKVSTSGSTFNVTDVPKSWVQRYQSLCLSSDEETAQVEAKIAPKIKKRPRSMSRIAHSKKRNALIQLEKQESLTQKTTMSGISRKADLILSKNAAEIKPECQTPNIITSTASKIKLPKQTRSCRNVSLSRKTLTNDLAPWPHNSKLGLVAKVTHQGGVANVNGDTFAGYDEKGSSVDPKTTSNTMVTEMLQTTPKRKERTNQCGDSKLLDSPEKENTERTPKQSANCLTTTGIKSGTEGRINDIVSALASWGYSIKNKVQGKETEPIKSSQDSTFNGDARPSCSKQSSKEVQMAQLNSKTLIDLIKNLTGSRKNRKLLRQISSVLGTDKTQGRTLRNSKSLSKAQTSPLAASVGTSVIVNSHVNVQNSKDKKGSNIASDPGSKASHDTKKGQAVKRRRIVRERSYFAKLASTSRKDVSNENDFYQPSSLPSFQSTTLSPPRLKNALKENLHRNTATHKRHRKSPKTSHLRRLVKTKKAPQVIKTTTSSVHIRKLNSLQQQGIPTGKDNLAVRESSRCRRDCKEDDENSPRSHLGKQSNVKINNKCSDEVETTTNLAGTTRVEKAVQVDEIKLISWNCKEPIKNVKNDMCVRQYNEIEKGLGTSEVSFKNEVVSCQFSQSVIRDNHFSQSVMKDHQYSQLMMKDNQSSQSMMKDNQSFKSVMKNNQSSKSVMTENQYFKSAMTENQSSKSVMKDNQSSQSVMKDNLSCQSVRRDNQSPKSVMNDNQYSKSVLKDNQSSKSVIKDNQYSKSVIKDNQYSKSVMKDNQSSKSVMTDNQSFKSLMKDYQSSQSVIKDNVKEVGNDNVKAQANENPEKQRKFDNPKKQKQTILAVTRPKQAISNKGKKSQISAGDTFPEIRTSKPFKRKPYITSSRSTGVVKSIALSKQPAPGKKTGNEKLQPKMASSDRPPLPVSTKHKEPQNLIFVKHGLKNTGITRPIANKTQENSRVAGKGGKQTSTEIRSRYEQFQKNTLQRNATVCSRKLPVKKEGSVKLDHNINRASLQQTGPVPGTDQTSATLGEIHTANISPALPPASTTKSNYSTETQAPALAMNLVETESRQTGYNPMLGACISFENDQFESHSDGEDVALETQNQGNMGQKSFNILKKSKLDIVVSCMMNTKSTFSTSNT